MSIITRSETVQCCKDYYINKTINIATAIPIIMGYCEEKGKSDEEISKLTQAIAINSRLIEWFLADSLYYFEVKFTICKLYKEVENTGIKQFLNIY